MLSEEMRVLYVALTRAKEKLIITGIEKDYKKSMDKKEEILNSYKIEEDIVKINKNIIQKHIKYLDWIELVYLKRKKELEEILNIYIHNRKEILKNELKLEEEEFSIEEKLKNIDKKVLNEIKEKLNWEYGYKIDNSILTKSSVTQIKKMKSNLEVLYKEPNFLKGEKQLTGAEKGSLVHLILQKLDEKVEYNEEKIKEFLEELKSRNIINDKEINAIDITKIYLFTKSIIWKSMKNAKEIQREMPFFINIPVKEIYNEDINENILIQGIIDLYYITDKNDLVLVDYKTDIVKKKEELIEKYKQQLDIYKKALETSLNRKVDRVYIYSVYLGEIIDMYI